MGLIDKALSVIGYTKSMNVTTGYAGQMFGYTSERQVSKPYANIPAVYKAIKAIIDNASNVGIKLENDKGEEISQFSELLDVLYNVVDEAGKGLTFTELIQAMAGYYAISGELFFIKLAETEGQLRGTQLSKLMLVNPKNVQEKTTGTNQLLGWYINGVLFQPDKIIHIKDFNPYNLFRGVSPIAVVMDELRIESGASEHLWSLFMNGATPGMIIETDNYMTPEQQKEMRQNWEAGTEEARTQARWLSSQVVLKLNSLA